MASYRFAGEHLYGKMVLTKSIPEERVDRMRGMSVIDGDILVASYPKTGTTWIGQLTSLITHNCDPEVVQHSSDIYRRLVFLESKYSEAVEDEYFSGAPRSPAIIKTHLTLPLLQNVLAQGRAKVVLIARNPKDTLVSFYHFYRMNSNLGNFAGSWDEFFELYKTKHILYGDYFDWYSSWLPLVNDPNVHLLKYEDMRANPAEGIRKLSSFLGKPLSDDKIRGIVEHTSFEKMKNNKSVNHSMMDNMKETISPFMRKGQVGDWTNYFSLEQSQYVDEEYRTKLQSKGLDLKFEL